MKFFLGLFTVAVGFAQVDVPHAGWMVDHSGALRPITGFAQNFIAGDAVRQGVLSASCGGSLCLVKTAAALFAINGAEEAETPAPPGRALISVLDQTALVYFSEVKQFGEVRDGRLRTLDWPVEGEVLAVQETREGPRVAVRRRDGVWIVGQDGSILAALPRHTTAVLLLDGVVVYSLPRRLVLLRADGSETSFEVPGVRSLAMLGSGIAQVSTKSSIFALRLDTSQISVLPDTEGVSQ